MFTTLYALLADTTEVSWQLRKKLLYNHRSVGYSQRVLGSPATFVK